jgi:hypothetical protein
MGWRDGKCLINTSGLTEHIGWGAAPGMPRVADYRNILCRVNVAETSSPSSLSTASGRRSKPQKRGGEEERRPRYGGTRYSSQRTEMQLSMPIDKMDVKTLRSTEATLAKWINGEADELKRQSLRVQLDAVTKQIKTKKRR